MWTVQRSYTSGLTKDETNLSLTKDRNESRQSRVGNQTVSQQPVLFDYSSLTHIILTISDV